MALKGTIKDFGVADILQLISQQAKTGVLVLRNGGDEVKVYFRDGSLVGAGHSIRTAEMLLGNLMMRAGVIDDKQLDEALRHQQRTLQKLGDVLIELRMTDPPTVKEFARLQMTETVYALFEWKQGTYEFDGDHEADDQQDVEPIRAENVVMNGIRMADEWPSIREKIPSYAWLAEVMRPLPAAKIASDEFDLSSLSEWDAGGSGPKSRVGEYERRVYNLIAPPRTVQNLIDLSRLGEFETCASLSTLMSEGYIRIIKPPDPSQLAGRRRLDLAELGRRTASILGRVALSATMVVVAVLLLWRASPLLGAGPGEGAVRYAPARVDDRLAEAQMRVLRRAVEVYRYQTGRYPTKLDSLVEVGLVRQDDLHFPYQESYYYRATVDGIVLLRPFR